jgi:hypothetical protein
MYFNQNEMIANATFIFMSPKSVTSIFVLNSAHFFYYVAKKNPLIPAGFEVKSNRSSRYFVNKKISSLFGATCNYYDLASNLQYCQKAMQQNNLNIFVNNTSIWKPADINNPFVGINNAVQTTTTSTSPTVSQTFSTTSIISSSSSNNNTLTLIEKNDTNIMKTQQSMQNTNDTLITTKETINVATVTSNAESTNGKEKFFYKIGFIIIFSGLFAIFTNIDPLQYCK